MATAAPISSARELVNRHGLGDRITLLHVKPGPLPFADASFDVVFSKDSILHISDKVALMADVARVLKPGGCFLASDWLIATEQPSEAMGAWMAAEGLEFSMATARDYRQALDSAGFKGIRITSRNAWYRSEARRERDQLLTAVQTLRLSAAEREYLEHETDLWNQMIAVLDTGEHCPSHLFARKPRQSACP